MILHFIGTHYVRNWVGFHVNKAMVALDTKELDIHLHVAILTRLGSELGFPVPFNACAINDENQLLVLHGNTEYYFDIYVDGKKITNEQAENIFEFEFI